MIIIATGQVDLNREVVILPILAVCMVSYNRLEEGPMSVQYYQHSSEILLYVHVICEHKYTGCELWYTELSNVILTFPPDSFADTKALSAKCV